MRKIFENFEDFLKVYEELNGIVNDKAQEFLNGLKTIKEFDNVFIRPNKGKYNVLFVAQTKNRFALIKNLPEIIEKELGYAKPEKKLLKFASSSIESLIYNDIVKGYRFIIVLKDSKSSNTNKTLYSTITELVPCIAILNEAPLDDFEKFFEHIANVMYDENRCYLNSNDEKSGKRFLEQSGIDIGYNNLEDLKIKDKMLNAFGIYKFLKEFLAKNNKTLKNIWWTYRAKPKGVNSKNPSDIVLEFDDGNMLGVSLKASSTNSKEPMLNTYISTVYKYFNKDIEELEKIAYEKIYKPLGLPENYRQRNEKKNTLQVLKELEDNEPDRYQELYFQLQSLVKENVANLMASNMDRLIEFIKENIIRFNKDDIPYIVVKAVKDKCHIVDYNSELLADIPFFKNVTVKYPPKNKQKIELVIQLENNNSKLMTFSVKSTKPGIDHKLGSFCSGLGFYFFSYEED